MEGSWKGRSKCKEKGGERQHKCSEQRAADRARTRVQSQGDHCVLSLGRGVLEMSTDKRFGAQAVLSYPKMQQQSAL